MKRLARHWRLLGRLARLSAQERRLLVEAASLVVPLRVALWVLPFRVVRRLSNPRPGYPRAAARPDDAATVERATRAVRRASRVVPGASCLTQALATRLLLARKGVPGELRIGVARSEAGRLEAHAWIVRNEKVVIGGIPDLARFEPLPLRADDGA